MVNRLPGLTPDRLDPEQRELYDAIARGPRSRGPQHFPLVDADGALLGPFNAMLLAPGLGAALQEVGAAIRFHGTLDARARELAILVVASRWDSAFERSSHEAVGLATDSRTPNWPPCGGATTPPSRARRASSYGSRVSSPTATSMMNSGTKPRARSAPLRSTS